ncbi:MAG: HAMP domain-containing histidine kinase [Deltaproteobacteria bacterium]|nr:HAMP domain-containing histidine kinase [Deltaproteobacteria bacterium]
MRRLYLHIYFALVCVLVLYAVLLGGAMWHMDFRDREQGWLGPLTSFADASIPPSDAPPERLERWARALAQPFDLELTIYDASGRTLIRVGRPLPAPPGERGSRFLTRGGHDHRTVALSLADGRWIVARGDRPGRFGPPFLAATVLLAVATGIAAYPVARRLTRRLEALKSHVDAFGEGRLALRVPVEGHDEIARLALAFNGTADRIERLVADKSRLLANTSHELRTPLARLRAALELLRAGPRPELIERAEQDLKELDGLIGELLVASRLDAPERVLEREAVDCLALAAEEAARVSGVEVGGHARVAFGDPRLLRRALRNLIENAIRHGEPPICVEIGDAPTPGRLQLVVSDGGPGVPEAERERIFEAYYRPPGRSSALGGVGLGLALVRQIAERHGGSVVCEPRPGGGTRFVLELPAAPA